MCKIVYNCQNNLEETEKDVNKINNKNTRNDFIKLKEDFYKVYQHEILTNDVLDEYVNKISEIDKSQ